MMKVERVLLVGLGSIGKRHLGNLKRLVPNVKVAVLRSREGAQSIDGCEVVSSLGTALDFQPQAAFICGPSSFHIDIATELARAGVHLFIEKPLSNKLGGLDEFVEMVQHVNIKVMVGYNLRFSPSLLTLRELIKRAKYGSALYVAVVVGQYLPDWRPGVDYRAAVSSQSELGGGALLELSHELDYLIWLFGEPVNVSGQLLKVSDLEIDVEDLVLANVCFDNDGRNIWVSLQLDFLQRKPYRSCKVICEQATLVWDALEDRVEVHQNKEMIIAFQGDKNMNYTYEQEVLRFIGCIEANVPVPITVVDGVRVMKLVEALIVSSEIGKVVYL